MGREVGNLWASEDLAILGVLSVLPVVNLGLGKSLSLFLSTHRIHFWEGLSHPSVNIKFNFSNFGYIESSDGKLQISWHMLAFWDQLIGYHPERRLNYQTLAPGASQYNNAHPWWSHCTFLNRYLLVRLFVHFNISVRHLTVFLGIDRESKVGLKVSLGKLYHWQLKTWCYH